MNKNRVFNLQFIELLHSLAATGQWEKYKQVLAARIRAAEFKGLLRPLDEQLPL